MKKLYIINLIAAALFSLQIGHAAPSQTKDEARYKLINEKWELKADGSQIYNCRKELVLYTHTAMNSTYGESFIVYNPLYQELKINESYTIQEDGSIVKTPENAFVEVLPKNAEGMPAYNHLKEMVVVHTGLELGATIVLDYSILSKPGYLPSIDVYKTVQQSSPVDAYEMTFIYPTGTSHHFTNNTRSKSSMVIKGEEKETVKLFIPACKALPRTPETGVKNRDIYTVSFHTYPTNAIALKGIYDQFDKAESVKEFTEKIIEGAETPYDKYHAIYDYVLHQIAYSPLSFENAGFRFRPAAEVIASAYATEIEKANLLQAMLNAAGFHAAPAAAYEMNQDADDLAISAVSEWFVTLESEEYGLLRLSAISAEPAAAGADFYITLKNGIRTDIAAQTRKIAFRADIQLKEEMAQAEVSADFSHSFLSNERVLSGRLITLDSSEITSQDQKGISIDGNTSVSLEKVGNLYIMPLPETQVGVNGFHYASYNSTRENNLRLPALFDECYEYSILLPQGMTLATGKQEVKVKNEIGEVCISMTGEDSRILVKRTLKTERCLITPAHYPAFRELMVEWNDSHLRQIVLKKK